MHNNRIIWNSYDPIIIHRRFLKPKIYHIIDTELQKTLEQIWKKYGH